MSESGVIQNLIYDEVFITFDSYYQLPLKHNTVWQYECAQFLGENALIHIATATMAAQSSSD